MFQRRVLVYGAGKLAGSLLKLRRRSDRRGFNIVAFVRADGDERSFEDPRVVRIPTSLLDYAVGAGVDEIVVAMDDRRGGFPIADLLACYKARSFTLYKFRSMVKDAEASGSPLWAAKRDSRVTRVGALLRKLRCDELPQLFNVISGTMSLVGPRPERPQIVERLSKEIPYYHERHVVKPGITGWAQLSYPYGASDQDALEKLQYDLYYIKNKSLIFDLMVLLQ